MNGGTVSTASNRGRPDMIMVFLEKEPTIDRYTYIKQLLSDYQLAVDPISVTVRITSSCTDSLYIARAVSMSSQLQGITVDAGKSTQEDFMLYGTRGSMALIYAT